jgi:SAM-dependent methyltransferase
VDIVDDGEVLATIPDASLDFVIANHFIEHCQDPIGAITNHFRVLKAGGILYLAVPDKRFTFDRDRPVTPISHLYQDHEIGPAQSRMEHYEDWVRYVGKVRGQRAIRDGATTLMEQDYSIHYHVWTQLDFLEFLLSLREHVSYDVETMLKQDNEFVIVLRKTRDGD